MQAVADATIEELDELMQVGNAFAACAQFLAGSASEALKDHYRRDPKAVLAVVGEEQRTNIEQAIATEDAMTVLNGLRGLVEVLGVPPRMAANVAGPGQMQ